MRVPILSSLASLAVIAGCSSIGSSLDDRPNAGPCPTVGSLYEASRIIEFEDEAEGFRNITYTGEIVDVRLFCRYVDDQPLLAEIELAFAFGRGPRGEEQVHDYTYFVAVTRRNSRVLNREKFTVRADFKDDPVIGVNDIVGRIEIPRVDESISGANFEVLVGFDLTDKQLQFNLDGKRFRLDAGQ